MLSWLMEKMKNDQNKVAILFTTSNNSDNNSNSKSRISKLITFLLFIKQVIFNGLEDQKNKKDKYDVVVIDRYDKFKHLT